MSPVDILNRRGFEDVSAIGEGDDEGMQIEVLPGRFDYKTLSPKLAEQAQAAAYEIRGRLRRSVRDVVEIGERLIEIRPFLSKRFLEWLEAEFGMSDRSARNFMYAAERFGDKLEIISNLDVTTVYLLAAPSTPEAARWDVLERMTLTDYTPTVAQVKEIIAVHKPPQGGGEAAARRRKFIENIALRVGIDEAAGMSPDGSVSAAGPGREGAVAGEALEPLEMNTRKEGGALLAPAPAHVCVELEVELRDSLVEALQLGALDAFISRKEAKRLAEQLLSEIARPGGGSA